MADDSDYLERAMSFSEKLSGERPSADELVNSFKLYGPEKRAVELQRLEDDMKDRPLTLRRAAEVGSFRRKVNALHQAMLKADR